MGRFPFPLLNEKQASDGGRGKRGLWVVLVAVANFQIHRKKNYVSFSTFFSPAKIEENTRKSSDICIFVVEMFVWRATLARWLVVM